MRDFVKGLCNTITMMMAFSAGAAAASAPIQIVKKSSSVDEVRELLTHTAVLLEMGAYEIRAPRGISLIDTYVVHTPNWSKLPPHLHPYVDLIDMVPNQFAVVRAKIGDVVKLSHLLHEEHDACGGIIKLTGREQPGIWADSATPVIPLSTEVRELHNWKTLIDPEGIKEHVGFLVDMGSRFHQTESGKRVAEHLGNRYRTFVTKDRDDVTIQKYNHGSLTPQDSLIVRIEGKTRPDEIIILGSHIDSINYYNREVAPGADDNASGTATNLEIFRTLMAMGKSFDRTIEIHGYAAEELGLVGSMDIAGDYRAANKNVIAMVQFDMNLFKPRGAADSIWFVTSNTTPSFNQQLAELVGLYVGVPTSSGRLSGGTSDHRAWNREGYVAAFPFENLANHNSKIHTSSDTVANADAFGQAAAFARMGLAYLVHFAGVREN